MHSSAASSLASIAFMVLIFGAMGIYYFIIYKKRLSPAAQAASLAAAGYRPGEGLRSHAIGDVLFIDDRDSLGGCGGNTRQVTTTITTHDRLLVETNGQRAWFEAHARPTIRKIGRIMCKDTTGFMDVLANQSETTIWFVRDGRPVPPGAGPKRAYNFHGATEDVHVLELLAPGMPPLRFEAVETAVIALYQWAQASAPMYPPPPMHAPYPHPVQQAPQVQVYAAYPYGPPQQWAPPGYPPR
jgi:hypothetical protein